MPTIRYTGEGGRYRAGGITFEPGDEAEVSAGLAEHLVENVGEFDRGNVTDVEFTEVDEGDGSGGQEDEPPDDRVPTYETEDYDPGEHTVDEIREHVDSTKDQRWLKLVRSAEAEGEERTTALEAIDDRLDELEE